MFYYNNIASVSPGRKHESCLVSGKTKACAAMETPTRLEEANGGEEGRRSGEPTAGLIQNSPAVGGDESGKTSVGLVTINVCAMCNHGERKKEQTHESKLGSYAHNF